MSDGLSDARREQLSWPATNRVKTEAGVREFWDNRTHGWAAWEKAKTTPGTVCCQGHDDPVMVVRRVDEYSLDFTLHQGGCVDPWDNWDIDWWMCHAPTTGIVIPGCETEAESGLAGYQIDAEGL